MRLTKYTHACVRLDGSGGALVLDPGIWSEPVALLGADAVLLSHAHADHADVLRLAGLGLPVHAPEELRLDPLGQQAGLTVNPVRVGDRLTVAGFGVRVVGGRHASVVDGTPVTNVGYVVEGRLLHPGDSLYVPTPDEITGDRLDLLLAPLHGSWLSTRELLRYVADVAPRRVVGIHEHGLSAAGLAAALRWLRRTGGDTVYWLAPGESIEL